MFGDLQGGGRDERLKKSLWMYYKKKNQKKSRCETDSVLNLWEKPRQKVFVYS